MGSQSQPLGPLPKDIILKLLKDDPSPQLYRSLSLTSHRLRRIASMTLPEVCRAPISDTEFFQISMRSNLVLYLFPVDPATDYLKIRLSPKSIDIIHPLYHEYLPLSHFRDRFSELMGQYPHFDLRLIYLTLKERLSCRRVDPNIHLRRTWELYFDRYLTIKKHYKSKSLEVTISQDKLIKISRRLYCETIHLAWIVGLTLEIQTEDQIIDLNNYPDGLGSDYLNFRIIEEFFPILQRECDTILSSRSPSTPSYLRSIVPEISADRSSSPNSLRMSTSSTRPSSSRSSHSMNQSPRDDDEEEILS